MVFRRLRAFGATVEVPINEALLVRLRHAAVEFEVGSDLAVDASLDVIGSARQARMSVADVGEEMVVVD